MTEEVLHITVIGSAESGLGAALLAQKLGHSVWVSDAGTISTPYKTELLKHNLPFEEQGHTFDKILRSDLIIKSPGVPNHAALIQELKKAGKLILSEIEFASQHYQGQVIGITGSNGKTTTTLLTGHLLHLGKISSQVAGNVGNSFAACLTGKTKLPDWFVLEVSSFQLDDCYAFAPHIAMILNITPDHLDRYEYSFTNYADAKFRILQAQKSSDYFIYHKENEGVSQGILRHKIKSKALPISTKPLSENEEGGWFDQEYLYYRILGSEVRIPFKDLPLQGIHNRLNMLAAGLAARIAGVTEQALKDGLATFVNAPHRLEVVADNQGILWINDSKATNVDSVYYALESMQRPVVWIAGGVDKGNDYTQIEKLVSEKVKTLIAMGKDNTPLLNFFKGKVSSIISTQSLDEALEIAYSSSTHGDAVLLSPACASFDLFKNYEDRGNQFRSKVQHLIKNQQNP